MRDYVNIFEKYSFYNKDRWILEAKMSIEAYACKLKKKNGKDIAKILFQMCECVSNFIRNRIF